MTEEIYGDVLFIINFSMDFLSLYITGKIIKIKMRPFRVILAASVGGIYGVAALFFPFDGITLILINIICAAFMCFIAFYYKSLSRVLLSTLIFYVSGMLLGGIMTAVYSKFGRYTGYISLGGNISTIFGNIPIWLFAVLAAVSAVITFVAGKIFSRRSAQKKSRVCIRIEGKIIETDCLVDSGNLLCEPITGTPVIFICKREAEVIPGEIITAMENGGEAKSLSVMKRLRFIPSSTVTGGAVIVAVVPDGCYVETNGKYEPKKALVAINFSGGDFDGFGGLVPKILL